MQGWFEGVRPPGAKTLCPSPALPSSKSLVVLFVCTTGRITGHSPFEAVPLSVHERLEKAHNDGGGLLGQVGGRREAGRAGFAGPGKALMMLVKL